MVDKENFGKWKKQWNEWILALALADATKNMTIVSSENYRDLTKPSHVDKSK